MRDQINIGSSSTGIDRWKSRSTTVVKRQKYTTSFRLTDWLNHVNGKIYLIKKKRGGGAEPLVIRNCIVLCRLIEHRESQARTPVRMVKVTYDNMCFFRIFCILISFAISTTSGTLDGGARTAFLIRQDRTKVSYLLSSNTPPARDS